MSKRKKKKAKFGLRGEGDDGGPCVWTTCRGGNEERVQYQTGGRRWRFEHGGGIRTVNRAVWLILSEQRRGLKTRKSASHTHTRRRLNAAWLSADLPLVADEVS